MEKLKYKKLIDFGKNHEFITYAIIQEYNICVLHYPQSEQCNDILQARDLTTWEIVWEIKPPLEFSVSNIEPPLPHERVSNSKFEIYLKRQENGRQVHFKRFAINLKTLKVLEEKVSIGKSCSKQGTYFSTLTVDLVCYNNIKINIP